MEAFYQWLREIVFCMCFLELLSHLIQGAEYRKYLKFVGGLIFMLIFLNPVFHLMDAAETLERGIWQINLQAEILESREEQKELAQLQNRQIETAYQEELRGQVKQVVQACGREARRVEVRLSKEETGEISQIRVKLEQNRVNGGDGQGEPEIIADTLCRMYGLELDEVMVEE